MSIKGFNVNGVTEQYDYNSLDNIPDIQGIPTGGTEGQVLAKTSGADYAVGWVNQTGGGGGGGSETDEIFWATRNVTTFAEVQEAVADGKLCAVKTGGTSSSDTYYLFYINDTRATFGNFSITNSRISTLSLYSSNSWTYESLTIPEELTFDTTPRQYSNNPVRSYGIWNAIQAAKTTVDAALSATSENPVQNRSVYEALATKADLSSVEPFVQDAVDEWMETYAPTIGTLSNAAKRALLNCFAHVAWIDNQGQSYYNALESELFPNATLDSITAVFTQGSSVIYDTDSLDTLKQYLVVTANYSDSTTEIVTDYTLTGALTNGTSTVTVIYSGKSATFNVTVTSAVWFSAENYTLNKSTPAIDTGIPILRVDQTYTIFLDVSQTTTENSGNATRFLLCVDGTTSPAWKGIYTGSKASIAYNAWEWMNWQSSQHGFLKNMKNARCKVAYVHEVGTTTVTFYFKLNDNAIAIETSTSQTLLHPAANLLVGDNAIANNAICTVNKVTVYKTALTATQIGELMAQGG